MINLNQISDKELNETIMNHNGKDGFMELTSELARRSLARHRAKDRETRCKGTVNYHSIVSVPTINNQFLK